jgi:hypothetical protein
MPAPGFDVPLQVRPWQQTLSCSTHGWPSPRPGGCTLGALLAVPERVLDFWEGLRRRQPTQRRIGNEFASSIIVKVAMRRDRTSAEPHGCAAQNDALTVERSARTMKVHQRLLLPLASATGRPAAPRPAGAVARNRPTSDQRDAFLRYETAGGAAARNSVR